MNELPAPPDAQDHPDATEILRVWVIGQDLQCSLNPAAFEDAATWGMALADLVRYVARALQEEEGKDPGETIRAIRAQFDAEMIAPPDDEEEGSVERDDIGQ
jgi:hypothetical protein